MGWTNSKVFRQFIGDMYTNVAAFDLDTDSIKAALYNNTGTPDKDVSAANSAYAAGQWVVGNEVSSPSQWAVGGVALGTKVVDVSVSGVIMFDAADTASTAGATLLTVFGVLVYEDTLAAPVADQGICYNYLGGTNSVTAGTFTVIWNTSGVNRVTV